MAGRWRERGWGNACAAGNVCAAPGTIVGLTGAPISPEAFQLLLPGTGFAPSSLFKADPSHSRGTHKRQGRFHVAPVYRCSQRPDQWQGSAEPTGSMGGHIISVVNEWFAQAKGEQWMSRGCMNEWTAESSQRCIWAGDNLSGSARVRRSAVTNGASRQAFTPRLALAQLTTPSVSPSSLPRPMGGPRCPFLACAKGGRVGLAHERFLSRDVRACGNHRSSRSSIHLRSRLICIFGGLHHAANYSPKLFQRLLDF
jgi:hypothetical protein